MQDLPLKLPYFSQWAGGSLRQHALKILTSDPNCQHMQLAFAHFGKVLSDRYLFVCLLAGRISSGPATTDA
jgi:hypothetical protein